MNRFWVKWWKDGLLHFTLSGIDRVYDPDNARWNITMWCPDLCKNILIGVEYAH